VSKPGFAHLFAEKLCFSVAVRNDFAGVPPLRPIKSAAEPQNKVDGSIGEA
jgi:hypothetical protein